MKFVKYLLDGNYITPEQIEKDPSYQANLKDKPEYIELMKENIAKHEFPNTKITQESVQNRIKPHQESYFRKEDGDKVTSVGGKVISMGGSNEGQERA